MAVIKIVPMPGAVGDKGDEGAPGAQGPQGPAGQNGLPGTPALWSYQGAYNPAAAYAVGDVVVYQGQLYYTKSVTTAGTLPTVTAKFDLIASKGADGTNGTNGADGADGATPFTLIGAYDNGAAYNLGIAVYYNGGTYVRTGNPLNPGYPPTLGAVNESWTPIAEKGADGSQLNYWDGASVPQDPAEDGFLIVDGIVATNGSNILVSADDRVFIGGNNGEFLNGLSTPENQIATIGDLTTPTSGTWNSRFYEENGIVPNLSGSVAPGYGNGRSQTDYPIRSNYYTIGDMVFWNLNAFVIDATQWGAITSNPVPGGVDYYRQWRFYLPFNHDPNFYGWTIDGLQSGEHASV